MKFLRYSWIAVIALVLFSVAGCSSDDDEPRSSSSSPPELLELGLPETEGGNPGLFPEFEPGVDSYVARCEDGSPLEVEVGEGAVAWVRKDKLLTGSAEARIPVGPGADFTVHVERGPTERSYSIRCLPRAFPEWSHERLQAGGDGLFMVSFPLQRWLIVFDQDGVPRWWYRSPHKALGGQIAEGGRVIVSRSFGDGYGKDPRMAHEVLTLDGRLVEVIRAHGAVIDAHEHYPLENGSYVDSYDPRTPVDLRQFGGPRNAGIVVGEIEQLDAQGRVVWEWDTEGEIGLDEAERFWPNILNIVKVAPTGRKFYDVHHLNTIEPWGDQIVISLKHTDAVYGVDRATGDIEWKLGGTERPESLRVVGDQYGYPLGGQHDSRIWGDGLLSIFDNQTNRGHVPRAVFYDLDLEAGTATFRMELTDPKALPTDSHCCGSVRRFGDGWLVGWGDTPWVTGFNDAGQITFRMEMAANSYRAIPVTPNQATPAQLEQALEQMEDQPFAAEEQPIPLLPPPSAPPMPPGEAKPVVLLMHGGSWLRGGPPAMDIPAQIARRVGLQPVKVEYPLGDIEAANATVRRIAQSWRDRGRTVVAFGESAGGQIATLLGAEGRVDYAVGHAPVSNLLTWWEGPDEQAFWQGELGADKAERRRLSPVFAPHRSPVLVLHSPDDPVVPISDSRAYARRYPEVTFQAVQGCHILDCDESRGYNYYRNSRLGLQWLADQAAAAAG